MDERIRYDSWWVAGPGRPCEKCKEGGSPHALAIRQQGPSFFPMHNFGPDRSSVPVRYLLVAQEPSEAGFDSRLQQGMDPEEARNYGGTTATGSIDSALQFAAREWLCESNETFLLTDMAKCAVRDSRREPPGRRGYRWNNCAPFLRDEANLFDVRAVIGVGGAARGALRDRAWGPRHLAFKVMHWAARDAHKKNLLASNEERHIPDETVEKYRAFMNERRAMLGKEPKKQKVGESAITTLAVYRKQFACIRRALTEPTFRCARREDGTCCRAVPAD